MSAPSKLTAVHVIIGAVSIAVIIFATAIRMPKESYHVECETQSTLMEVDTPFKSNLEHGTVSLPDGRIYIIPGDTACEQTVVPAK